MKNFASMVISTLIATNVFAQNSLIQPTLPSEDYYKSGIITFTEQDSSDILKPKYINHFAKLVEDTNSKFFFKINVNTGVGINSTPVEYKVLFFAVDLLNYRPSSTAMAINPSSGSFSMSFPDNYMKANIWVIGYLVDPKSAPANTANLSPWRLVNEVGLYTKP